MKNKRILVIIILAAAVLAIAIYFLWPKNKQNAAQTNEQLLNQSVIGFNQTGEGVLFDPQSNTIKKFNPTTGQLEDFLSIKDEKPNYAAISDDSKSLLYTTDSSTEQSDTGGFASENLSIVSLDNAFAKLQEKNIFSPVWLDNSNIAYYLPGKNQGSIVLRNIQTNKITKQIKVNAVGSQELSVLDDTHLLANDYSSDVSNVSSKIINLSNGEITPYLSGLGLKFKTVPGSKYLSFQIIKDDEALTKILAWKSGNKILEMAETIDNFDWLNTDKEIIYGTGGQLYRFDIANSKTTKLNKSYAEPLLVVKILSGNKLFLKTEGKTQIVDL